MAVTFRQAKAGTGGFVQSVQLDTPVHHGALLVALAGARERFAGFSSIVVGDGVNQWQQIDSQTGDANVGAWLWYAWNVAAGVTNVSMTLVGGGGIDDFGDLLVAEWTGIASDVDPLDQHVAAHAIASSGPTAATTGPGLVLGAFVGWSGSLTPTDSKQLRIAADHSAMADATAGAGVQSSSWGGDPAYYAAVFCAAFRTAAASRSTRQSYVGMPV